jgi:hypothetical protein
MSNTCSGNFANEFPLFQSSFSNFINLCHSLHRIYTESSYVNQHAAISFQQDQHLRPLVWTCSATAIEATSLTLRHSQWFDKLNSGGGSGSKSYYQSQREEKEVDDKLHVDCGWRVRYDFLSSYRKSARSFERPNVSYFPSQYQEHMNHNRYVERSHIYTWKPVLFNSFR